MRIQSVSSRVGWTIALVAMVVVAPRATFAQVEVNTCEQVYSGDGYLSADLDCSGFRDPIFMPEYVGKVVPPVFAPTAVLIKHGGTLDLRGHTINLGGLATPGPDFGVVCLYRGCKVFNGTITNALTQGVFSGPKIEMRNLAITNSQQEGLYAGGRAVIVDSTITGNAGTGVRADKGAKLTGSTVSGNGEEGVVAPTIKLRDSNVSGNSTNGPCGDYCTGPCADLRSHHKPRLRDSICGLSLNTRLGSACAQPGATTWHICTGD